MESVNIIQYHDDDTNPGCNSHNSNGIDMNCPTVFALIIINETC